MREHHIRPYRPLANPSTMYPYRLTHQVHTTPNKPRKPASGPTTLFPLAQSRATTATTPTRCRWDTEGRTWCSCATTVSKCHACFRLGGGMKRKDTHRSQTNHSGLSPHVFNARYAYRIASALLHASTSAVNACEDAVLAGKQYHIIQTWMTRAITWSAVVDTGDLTSPAIYQRNSKTGQTVRRT
jgi:hypothetical protein